MNLCPTCKRPTTALFLSVCCDHCDYGPSLEKLHRGFVLHPSAPLEYVFRTRLDAERWQTVVGRAAEIREVYSLTAFRWHLATGCIRGVVFADYLFEVMPDHRYEPSGNRVFLKGVA